MHLAEVYGTLTALNVQEDVIRDVMRMLETHATQLEARNVPEINKDAFGQSSWGAQLGFDAGLAQETVRQEVLDMVAGLRGYSQNLEQFAAEVTETDTDSATTLKSFQLATDCVAAPTFSSPGQCTLPTDGGDS